MIAANVDFLPSITIGEPQTHANMAVYPLHISKEAAERRYHTLDEAAANDTFVIREVSDGGTVPTLTVENKGTLPLLMVVGEELIGAKQNRVLNTTLLVPAESELQIPVSCVEQGRWAYTSRAFSVSPTPSHSRLRSQQVKSVTTNLRNDRAFMADQGAVWGEVSRKIRSHRSISTTRALHDVYDQTQTDVEEYLNAFSVPEAEGIMIAINGELVGADLFDHPQTLQQLHPKLIRSYALDAVEQRDESSPKTADTSVFIQAVQDAKRETYDSVGLGKDVRLSSEVVTGSSLLWENHAVHTTWFKMELSR